MSRRHRREVFPRVVAAARRTRGVPRGDILRGNKSPNPAETRRDVVCACACVRRTIKGPRAAAVAVRGGERETKTRPGPTVACPWGDASVRDHLSSSPSSPSHAHGGNDDVRPRVT